jgi:hypothetical protein
MFSYNVFSYNVFSYNVPRLRLRAPSALELLRKSARTLDRTRFAERPRTLAQQIGHSRHVAPGEGLIRVRDVPGNGRGQTATPESAVAG